MPTKCAPTPPEAEAQHALHQQSALVGGNNAGANEKCRSLIVLSNELRGYGMRGGILIDA